MKNEKGFTLFEILVAFGLFAIIAAGMTPVFISQVQFNTESEQRTGAIAAAQRKLDELRLVSPDTLPSSGTSSAEDITVGERTYQVTVTYCAKGAYCGSKLRHLTLNSFYQGEELYAVETVYTSLR